MNELRKIAKSIVSKSNLDQKVLNEALKELDNEYNFNKIFDIKANVNELSDKYKRVKTISIEPKHIGILGPLIKSGDVGISIGIYEYDPNEFKIYVKLDYSYTHPSGGNNGYSVQYAYDTNDKKWEYR